MQAAEIIYTINVAQVSDILAHFENCDALFIPPLHTKVNINDYSKKIRLNAVTFEAWYEKKIIGLVACYLNNDNTKQGFITNVSVINTYQNLGISNHLLLQCFTYASQHLYDNLILEVNKLNRPAIHLYKKNGFYVIEDKLYSQIMLKKIKTN